MMNWSKVNDLIHAHQTFALTAHMFPDGDAVGSEMALYHHLKRLGKNVIIVNNQPTYRVHDFLDPDQVIELFDPNKHPEKIAQAEVIFIVDVSSWNYMGRVGESVQKAPAKKVCIDHHVKSGDFVDLDFVSEEACATGELVYDFFKVMEHPISPEMATALYTAIITDTGVFRFSNTSARAHEIAADLFNLGIDHNKIYQRLYERNSWSQLRLQSLCMDKIHSECDGKMAWIHITEAMLHQAKASWDESNGLIDLIRTIEGVKVSILFREYQDGSIKVHFRSKDGITVQGLASKLGGGGHRVAAGASLTGPADKVIPDVIEQAKKLF